MGEFETKLKKALNHKYENNKHIKELFEKLNSEKEFWSQAYQKQYFTGALSICQRNEHIKAHLKTSIINKALNVPDAFNKLLQMSDKDFLQTNEYTMINQ
jgi:hypothetical protein